MTVETPEGVDFQFVIAGPGKRAQAWLLDLVLKAGILCILGFALIAAGTSSRDVDEISTGMLLVLIFLIDWFCNSVFEACWNGQTPGKRSLGLRVIRTNGTPIDVSSAIGRNLLRAADMLPLFYTVGLLSMASTRRMQRLGDICFDTMVIEERKEWISLAGGLTKKADPLLRSECPRGFHVPERTLALIERLFETDRIISDARREEIARPLADCLRKRLGFVEPQPDPKNPHTFFMAQGFRHTLFLLRILRTFAEGPRES